MTGIISTIIVGLAVTGLIAFAVMTILKDRRNGKSCGGCGGSCCGCTGCEDFYRHTPDSVSYMKKKKNM